MGWHIIITEEMRALGLSGNDLMVFALIHGYSQKGQGCFFGRLSYICDVCGITKPTAIAILKDLVARGLVEKRKMGNQIVYIAGKEILPSKVKKLNRKSKEILPHDNIDIYKSSIEIEDNSAPRFEFKKNLLGLGVSAEVASAWMLVRKNKRATNTEIAFSKILEEIKKSGRTAEECIRTAVENSWSGFRAEWLESKNSSAPKKTESVFEHNLREIDEMFGTNYHEQTYGK